MRRVLFVAVVAAIASLIVVPAAAGWAWPADGPVLRPFSLAEDEYAAGQHRGIDIGAAAGEPVRSPAAGTVSFAGSIPGGGRALTIQTADGYAVTLLQLGAVAVARGERGRRGRGRRHRSARARTPSPTAPHVHLGIRVAAEPNGYVDPALLLPARAPAGRCPSLRLQPRLSSPEPAPPSPAAVEPLPAAAASAPVVAAPPAEAGAPEPVAAEPPQERVAPTASIAPVQASGVRGAAAATCRAGRHACGGAARLEGARTTSPARPLPVARRAARGSAHPRQPAAPASVRFGASATASARPPHHVRSGAARRIRPRDAIRPAAERDPSASLTAGGGHGSADPARRCGRSGRDCGPGRPQGCAYH